MFDERDRKYFYDEFKNNGYEVGSYDDFKKDLNNKEDRDWYYNEAKNMGYDVGTQADFDKMVLEPAPSTSGGGKQVDASATTQSVEQKASTETKPQVAQPAKKQETIDKEPGLIAKVLDMIPTGVQTSNGTYQPSPAISQPVVKGEEKPVKEETSPSSSANAAPVTTPTGVVNNEGLMDAKLANYIEDWKQRPDKEGDYFANMVADLLADGTANSNEEAVNMVMPALHRYANRSAMDVTNQVVSSLPDDTVQDAEQSIEAQWYSHGVQDKLKQEADSMGISYDDYVAHFLKPAMVQSLVNKYGPNYRNIAEGIATRLYAHDENVQDRLMNQDINDALSNVINKYVSPSVVDEYNKAQEAGSKAFLEGMEGSQFIPANLRLGTALGAQYEANEAKDPAKVLSGLQQKFGKLYRNPKFLNDMSNAAFKVMQRYGLNGNLSGNPKQFKPMINAAIKNELDQLEIKGMMPKGSAEYIMKTGLGNTIAGKIIRKAVQTDYQNWLEDIANQQYQPGFWENVASGALTFAGDAWSYWLPGAAGGKLTKSMVAKAEGKLAGDLMAKGMERKMAERAAKVLIGKSKAEALKSGAVHGAVTFGGQSAISKPIDEVYRTGQFDENGKIYNPSVGKVIANTLGEVAKQSAVGAIMQGGTIANMVGKGRGLATNILADVGGKVVDSGIMTGHQMLERMAQDPNFKPTGKDAAESFLESMANLTAIGLPGMVGKYARFKDAREFNKKFDFTDQDIAELKRFGYDGLRDAFEKVGIGEYAVVGENAQRLDGQLTQKYMDLMNDKSVPEVLKAKMMAVVEGKRPSSFSPVVDSEVYRGDDGKYYLETYNKDGGVIDRKEYSSHDAARNDEKKLEYEKTLGLASVLEGEFHNEFTQEHLEGLYNKAAQKYNMGEKLTDEDKAAVYLHQNAGAIKEIMDKQQKGFILTDEEQKQINAYRHYYDSALENSSVMREFVNTFEDSNGVARGTLRKALESKDKKYAPLVESYLKELYNSIELKREMKQTMDDLYNTSHGNGQKRIEGENPVSPVEGSAGGQEPPVSEGPAPYQDRTKTVPTPSDAEFAANPANVSNSSAEGVSPETKVAGSDAFVMGQNAYKNGDSEALQAIYYNSDLATGRLKRAFADNEKMPDIVANAYNEGRDMEQFVAQRASSLTPAQKEAISKYVEAMDAKKGTIDALQHADDGYGEALKEQLWPYQTEDGNIVPATLDSGKQVFLKKDNEYGGAFVVVPDEQGLPTIKQVPKASIIEKGTPVPLDQYIEKAVAQQKDARNKQFISQFDGSGLKRGDIVSVSMEEGDEPSDVKIVGYTDDGHVILTDTDIDVNAQIDPKKLESVTKDKFNAWRQNALNVSIGAELDAEDAQRANDDAAKAEADKKQRYVNGIVGLSEGHPDYSSKDTDTKVAADYLQEQYGEDHGKLLNLVNGSRDDIKTQLDNKKKAAAEYQNWLDTNADLDPEKAKKVEDELSLANEQIADLDARFKNWNTIRNSVMTPDEVKAMTEERKAEVEKAGVDETAIVPSDDFHVLVLDDKELKKQYPTMDKANDYITSQRKDIYHTQEDVERKINEVNDMLEQYINGETELEPNQLMELNTTKAQLEALQTNLSVAAKGLKAQANKLSKLYKTEVSQQEMEELGMTPSEQRKVLVSDAIKKNDLGAIIKIYKDASVDVTDFTPQTLEEAVSEFLSPHSLNPESLQYELGKSNFKFGIGKGYDSNKFNYLIAKKGTGMSVNEFAVKVYNDLPVNLQDMGYTDQDVRNTLLDMFKSYDSVKEMKNVALMNRIAAAEDELASEEEYYEAQKEREIIERQAEIEKYKSYIHEKELSLPSESELDHINGLEFDRMMEIEDREREYKQYVKSILPELADYDDRSNEEGYGGGSSLGSDSSRRGVDEGNSQGEEVGNGEASSESEIGEGSDSGRKGRQEISSMEPGEGSAVRGSHLPQEASFGERLKSAIAETETEPTEAQKKAGNYKKGHLSFGGYDYTVETPKGVTRSGKDEQGKPWSVTMHDTYGYILGKIGVDGDHIDMFINDAADLDTFDGNVYVVDQVNPETGEFDEHKVMYGYPDEAAATKAYLSNYSKGWKGLGKVTSVPKVTFDKWLESSDRKTKPFADYAMVQKEQAKFDRDVKEVEPSEMTEAQKVAYDAVSTMLKKAGIPVKVVSNEDMEKVAEAQGKGVVNGYTDGKEIVLNQEHLNPNTPIHEYQHLWRTAAKNMNPELIEYGDKLIMQTQLFADLKQDPNYNHLTDEQICDEAFARLTGEDGAAILEQMAKDAIKENPLDTAKELSVINKLKEWLKKFWYWTLDTFTKWKPEDIKKMTLEDIRNLVLRDLANGVDPRNVKSRMTKEESVEDKIKAVSQQFGVDEADVAMYANAVKKGSTAEAARARANIKRHLLQANEDKISSLKELLKYTKPVNEALKENFGDVDAMIEERVKQVEAQRNAMEAARKRAEEEEAKRQKHLEELSVIPDDQLDKQYMDALAKGDDATAREMLDEAARRKGYDDTESSYQGVGAWKAPGNPGYESDKARRDDWESSGSDVNLEDMALGYTPQPDDYFSHPERYSQNTPHGLESVKAINTAIDAIKNGEKDVKVKVYRAVPTSVKEGKLRNGDWVTPSKKYADIHGNNRLEGKYRIIEDEVPATQLWWDGNDANEFGFDDGKEYKYKNAKNNRKLNDLVTYDDEGDVIPPSKRFNSRKKDIRFMFAGEKGAAEADKADEQTIRMDNLDVAKQMEEEKKDAKIIKMATGWEKGVDGKWRYEMPDAKIKDTIDVGGGNIVKRFEEDMLWTDGKLEDAVDAPKLFEAYPQLKNIKIHTDAVMNDMPSNGEYNPQTKTITIHADELKYLNSILNHEIQHVIQREEGFAHGGTPEQVERDFNAAKAEWKARSYAFELEEKAKEMGGEYNQSEVEKALIQEYKDMDMPEFIPDKETRIKGFNYFARGYADRSMDDAIKRFRLDRFQRTDFDSYQEYRKLAGEVEARNVQKRLGMTDEERRNFLASETEDVNRDEQIVMNGNDASYSIVKDPEIIKKLDKEDTVKVYRAMQVGEDGKLYPPMAAKVKGKFVQPIELGKWEQADERPELADDKGMFTLNKGNGKSLKAAYNPYLHTSRTPLNDQFSEAQNRPNIVTVEVEVPKSELTSGYKADKAKDAVGEVEWKAGIIQGQLTGKRKVVLSRWDKPVRIVPDSEVADVIVNDMFKGKNITMPSNVVTPSLRKELEKRGVPFVETDNRGRIVGGENDGVHYSKVYGKNHREKGYRSILKFSLGENGTDIAAGNGDSINKNPNKNVITRRIGSRAQAQRRVNETLGAAASDFRRDQTAAAENQQGTWDRESVLGHVIRAAKANASFISQEELKKIVGENIGYGEENYVYRAKYDNQKVIKLNDFSMTDNLFRINEFIDRINAHNEFMPKDKYTPLGFAYNHKGDPCIVMEQPYIRGTQPTNEEISQYLMDHGFKIDMIQISADESDLGWTNGKFDLWDAEPRNVIKDKNGDLHFFDTMIQHTYIPNHKNPLRLSKSSIRTFESQEMMDSAERVKRVANVLGGAKAVTYTSSADVPEEYRIAIEQGARGWYDPTTHTVHVYLPNCADANEAERTVLHEKIGHEGMEVLLDGEDGVRKFANFVYRSVGKNVRGKIIDFANKYDPDWKNPDRMNVGTQEYIAHLAEEGPKTAEDFSLWTKIKHYLIKVLKKLGIRVPGLLNDKDLRYYLMKAGKALHVWDNMPKEKQEAMMKQANNAEIKDALSDGAGKGKPRQKKGESTIQYMKRVQEWRKWQNAREDENDPEPPMFYDIDKDEAGKKEWAQLNKDWRERHHLAGEEPMGMPIRMEGEEDGAYMTRIHEYEKWKEAMKDQEDPMPDMFAYEKKKQEEVKRKYEDWLARHELLEQQQADLDLYEGKIYPAETNPKADALEQQVMQDLAEVTSTDVSKEGAAKTVKHAVIHRRKNMEEASADDAIYINDVKNRIEKMADSGAFDKLLSDYKGKPNRAEKLAEAIPYIIEAPRRLRDLANDLNATGAFDKGHIHIQPADVEAIQPFVADLIAQTGKKHTELKDGKEVELYDDPQAVGEVASKMAQTINANHQGEEGFVPIDGSDILSEHVLPLVKQQIVPEGIDYKNLSPEMKASIDSIRDWYNYTYDWLKDNHTLREDTGYNADYVNHIWDKEKSDKQAYAMYVENRQRTKSPNEKPRTISTLMEGISVGLVPKTTDITKMMAYYSRSNIEAWVNKTMLQELSGLNVIERNEDGEIISSDPLLSSTPPFNLEQYQYFEIPGVGPVWVYNVSPKQVKVKNPITGKEKVLYSEASAGDRFGVVFETYQSSPFWKAFDTLASSAKKLELGFSGFHAGALTEVYMVQNMVEFGPKKAMANFMKYIFADTAKNHELPCFANPQDFQEAATHLVKFGATNDYAAADVQNMFDNMRDAMMKVQEKLKDGNKISGTVAVATMPLKVVTQLLSLINKGMDRALWDFLHDGLKLATYRMRADKTKERAKKKGWTEEELSRALDEDGQFVNDMFGGQHWDVLGASHRTLRYAGRVLLSPDWNASTTRHFLALTGFGSIWNEATFENFKQYYQRLWHKELMPEDEGRRSRQISALLCYGIGFMVFYEAFANGINAAFRAMDEEKERKKAEEIRKTNPSYKSMYELAYGDEGMKWYDYLMRGNSLGQQSKIFLGRYADGTEMYIRHGKQFREVPEYLFNHKGELEFPGPMVQRMIGKANPMVRMTLDDINYLSDFQASHADQEIQRKYGKTIGLLYKDALYWAPFLIPSQENKEFKAVDFFFPSSKGFSPWKAQSYFKDFILSGDMEGVVMTYQSCQRNGIDAEAQIKAAIGSVKALESAEMSDGVTSLQEASKRFDAAKSITEKKKMRQKMKKFLSQSDYKAFTQKEALDMVQGYLNGDEDLKEMEKAESKYLMKAKAEDVTEDWRIQNVWNGTMETYQEYKRLKDVDKAKANAFKNSKTNKRLFAARKVISAARRKMNKAKKQMDGTNDAAKLVEIRNTRKELLEKLNGME